MRVFRYPLRLLNAYATDCVMRAEPAGGGDVPAASRMSAGTRVKGSEQRRALRKSEFARIEGFDSARIC